MAKKINEATWLKIKTEYQFGDKSIRQVAGENGVSDAAVRARIQNEGWVQNMRTQVIDLKKNIEDISQNITPEQIPIVAEKIKTLLDTQLEAFGLIKDTAILALKAHKNITTIAYNKLREAKTATEVYQISSILKSQGLDVPGSMKAIGIQEDRPTQKDNAEDSTLTPAEAYNLLIKGQ